MIAHCRVAKRMGECSSCSNNHSKRGVLPMVNKEKHQSCKIDTTLDGVHLNQRESKHDQEGYPNQ